MKTALTRLGTLKVIRITLVIVTCSGAVVAGFLLPPATPIIIVAGISVLSLISQEIIKSFVGKYSGKCFPTCPEDVHSDRTLYTYDHQEELSKEGHIIRTTETYTGSHPREFVNSNDEPTRSLKEPTRSLKSTNSTNSTNSPPNETECVVI